MLAAELRDSDAALLQWRNELLQQQTQLGAAGAAAVAALSAATTPARIYKLLLQATDSTTMQIVCCPGRSSNCVLTIDVIIRLPPGASYRRI